MVRSISSRAFVQRADPGDDARIVDHGVVDMSGQCRFHRSRVHQVDADRNSARPGAKGIQRGTGSGERMNDGALAGGQCLHQCSADSAGCAGHKYGLGHDGRSF